MSAVGTPPKASARVHTDKYDSAGKTECYHKACANAVLGRLSLHRIKATRDESAVILDDIEMASSHAVRNNTSLAPKNIIVINFGDADKLAKMQQHKVANVVSGDAHHDVHVLPIDGKLRIAFLDFCCTGDEIVDGGSIPASVARMAKDKVNLLAVTFSRRNSRKYKNPQPGHMLSVIHRVSKMHGLRAYTVFEDAYRPAMLHMQLLLLPEGMSKVQRDWEVASAIKLAQEASDAVEVGEGVDVDDSSAEDTDESISDTDEDSTSEESCPEYVYHKIYDIRKNKRTDDWEYKVEWSDRTCTWEPGSSFSKGDVRAHGQMAKLRNEECERLRKQQDAKDHAEFQAYKAKLLADWEAGLTVTAAAETPAGATRSALAGNKRMRV